MHDSVVEFGYLTAVPAIGRTYQITRDTLENIDIMRVANRTFGQTFSCILISAIHAAVAIVVHRTIADIIFVHQIHDLHDGFGIVRSITIDFHIENMATAGKVVLRTLNLSLMTRRAVVLYGYVVGVGIIILIRYARNNTEIFLIALGETAGETFCWRSENRIVMLILL